MLYNAIHHLHKDHLPCQNKRGSEHSLLRIVLCHHHLQT